MPLTVMYLSVTIPTIWTNQATLLSFPEMLYLFFPNGKRPRFFNSFLYFNGLF